MTATPRQLSDAIEADCDEIIASNHSAQMRHIERWELVRSIAVWVYMAAALTLFGLGVLASLTGSLTIWTLFMLVLNFGLCAVVPLAVLWISALYIARQLRKQLASKMFTLYGVTVDHSIAPPIYSVAGMHPSHMDPALHRSWQLLTGADLKVADVGPAKEE